MLVSVVSPERALFEGEADSITIPGSQGSFTVLQGHANLIAELIPGELKLFAKGKEHKYVVDGGFIDVNQSQVTVLVEGASSTEEYEISDEEKCLEELLAQVTTSDTEYEEHAKQILITRAKIRAKNQI